MRFYFKQGLEQVGARLSRCAGGILWRGQKKGAARIGNTGKPFDEPTTQKTPALRVALWRAPAVSPRSTVLPIRSSRGSWRITAPQRNAVGSIGPQLALAVGVLGLLCSTAAHAELPLVGIIAQGRAVIDLRSRFETVSDNSKTLDANAVTVRARLGYDTGYWNNFQLGFDFDQIWTVGGATYNSTRNGKTAYPTIADPAMTALNRLTLSYASDFDTKFTIGRQRLLIGNQRFVGNAGWRQHEQTYDSLSAVNTSIEDLTFTYAYLYRVNRIGGPAIPLPSNTTASATGLANYFKSDSHVMDAVYIGVDHLRLEGYAFLLDLSAPSYATAAAQQTATSRLSTATYGGRADYTFPLVEDVTAKLTGEFAHQTGYANNPLSISLNYWLGEGSLTYKGLTGLVGYEVLEGNG
ncbi:MAG TPA: hypothetical protein VJS85_02835, partial [Rhizomicrobium sp.]|nr:hypothetical protein [Rhizomicrobium sp.]